MALPKFEKDIGYVSKLSDYPNVLDGLSAAELKARFDQAALDLQAYINNELIPQTETELTKAAMGEKPEGTLNGGDLAIGSVSGDKLAYKTVTNDKIAENAVGMEELADSAVSTEKLALKSVTGAKVADKAIEGSHLNDNIVSTAKLRDSSVTNTKLAPNSVSNDKLAPNSTHTVLTAVLPASGWQGNAQTVTLTGISASYDFIVAPAASNHIEWCEAGVYCSAAAANSLSFKCVDAPSADLRGIITILR